MTQPAFYFFANCVCVRMVPETIIRLQYLKFKEQVLFFFASFIQFLLVQPFAKQIRQLSVVQVAHEEMGVAFDAQFRQFN